MSFHGFRELLECMKACRKESQWLVLLPLIDALSNEERLILRNAAELNGIKRLPRSLYYNYQTQTYID